MKLSPRWIVLFVVLATAAGCGNLLDSDSARAVLTQAQRDSVLAESALPGARVVGRALEISDRSANRAAGLGAELDSLSR